MNKLLLPGLLLLCSLTSPTISLAQTVSDICLPYTQAAVIGSSLKKYEALKPAYKSLQESNSALRTTNNVLYQKTSNLEKSLAFSQSSYILTDSLYINEKVVSSQWKAKAQKRGLKLGLVGTIATALLAALVLSR